MTKKTKIEIEIPEGHKVQAVQCLGPHVDNGIVYRVFIGLDKPFDISGEPAEWPEWLDCDWIAKHKNEHIYAYYTDPPVIGSESWIEKHFKCGRLFGTTLKIPGPWEESLHENPKRKKLK